MEPITVFVPLPPSYRGGTEEYAYRVAAYLAEGWPVRVVSTTVRWAPGPDVLPTGRASLELLAGRELFQRPVLISRSVRRRIRELVRGSSLVHLHMPFPMVERWVAKEAVAAGVPTLLTYHMDAELGAATGRPSGRLVTALYRTLSARPALRRASAVVSNSRGYSRASPVLSHFDAKVRVVPKGIDPGRFGVTGDLARATPGTDDPWAAVQPPVKRLFFVGRLVPYKGLPLLLEAVDRLRKRGVDLRLWIAGRGPEEPRLRAQIERSGLADIVRMLGFVPDVELGSLYRGADLVVCPSLNLLESTPTSLEEAAAFGTPTVGSALPGAAESLPNDGVRGRLVPPGDPTALTGAIDEMLKIPRPPAATTLRTWADTGADYARLIRELLPGRTLGEDPPPEGAHHNEVGSAAAKVS